MHDRSEWERGTPGPKTIKGREYKNLIEFKRPCASCGEPFSIYVTSKIANGHADSNSFALKNCEKHRRNRSAADESEVETLRTANVTMREELTGLYEQVRTQFEELQICKAKLAQYELPAALVEQAANMMTTAMAVPFGGGPDYDAFDAHGIGCEPVQNTSNGALPKHPWEA
jgi:hypothetical protein